MRFTTNNVQTSLTLSLAAFLQSKGYDVLWRATGEVEGQTAGLSATRGTVTFTPEFPENPAYIVRKQGLNGGSSASEELVVPALTLQVLDDPIEDKILGLGHTERIWQRDLRIDVLATDAFQQRDLADLLVEWLKFPINRRFTIYDFDTDPANPPALSDEMQVELARVYRKTLPLEVEAARHYCYGTAVLTYVE